MVFLQGPHTQKFNNDIQMSHVLKRTSLYQATIILVQYAS